MERPRLATRLATETRTPKTPKSTQQYLLGSTVNVQATDDGPSKEPTYSSNIFVLWETDIQYKDLRMFEMVSTRKNEE